MNRRNSELERTRDDSMARAATMSSYQAMRSGSLQGCEGNIHEIVSGGWWGVGKTWSLVAAAQDSGSRPWAARPAYGSSSSWLAPCA